MIRQPESDKQSEQEQRDAAGRPGAEGYKEIVMGRSNASLPASDRTATPTI